MASVANPQLSLSAATQGSATVGVVRALERGCRDPKATVAVLQA